jgi:hypothetical protein
MTASASPAEELRLRDGLTFSVRTVTPDDEDALWEFLTGLSIDSRRLRFFGAATGLATLLMIRLAEFGEDREISRFFAEVLPENRDMLAVFPDGFAAGTLNGPDVIEVEFPTYSWRTAHARFRAQAAARSR